MTDAGTKKLWDELALGYTESQGSPLLREEVSKMYDDIPAAGVIIGAPQELILLGLSQALEEGDHCIVTFPGYQVGAAAAARAHTPASCPRETGTRSGLYTVRRIAAAIYV